MDPNSDFQKKIVQYLESVHIGEFMTGTMDEVKEQVRENMKAEEYQDPTQTLPDPPPEFKDCDCEKCESCKNTANWWEKFKNTVDGLILRSNVHPCCTSIPADEKRIKKNEEVVLTNMAIVRLNTSLGYPLLITGRPVGKLAGMETCRSKSPVITGLHRSRCMFLVLQVPATSTCQTVVFLFFT